MFLNFKIGLFSVTWLIQNIIVYRKMFKEIKSSKTFQKSLRVFKEFNLRVRILIGLKKVMPKNSNSDHKGQSILINKKVFILTPPDLYFIAKLIQRQLDIFSFESEIIYNEPQHGFNSDLYFVISPQKFKKLPEEYIAFQMEHLDLKWMDNNHLEILKNAKCIFDSSLQNIDFLQNNTIPFKKIFYLPIYYNRYEALNYENNEEYDVAFCGDINNERFKKYLDTFALLENFNVKVIDGLYGEELYSALSKARIILNIHENQNSNFETTRIYEYLSLNKLVVSETAKDINHYDLIDIVEFTPIGDVNEMIEKISYWLTNDKARLEKIERNTKKLENSQDLFSFYFNRFLLSNNVIGYNEFVENTSHPHIKNNFVCLSLPETPLRILSFTKENKNAHIFNGLRHTVGWVGCGLSYKYILHLAKQHQFDCIIVCEDDVEFHADFDSKLAIITSYLSQNPDNWDLFSGFIADVHRETEVTKIELFHDMEFVYIDKLMSTVFNIYNKSFFDKLEDWDQNNLNKEINTIDRFMESTGSLRIVTTLPYLVGHKEELASSIWNNVQNTDFTKQINKSTALLESKISFYKKKNKIKSFFAFR